MDHDSTKATVAQVQSILRIANNLKEATASYSSRHQTLAAKNILPIADSFTLPSPRSLLPSLLDAGISHEIATAANRIYQQRTEEFKQHIEQTVTAACLGMPPSGSSPDLLMSKVFATFTEIYLRRLAMWREEIVQRVKQAPKVATKVASKNSRSFNHVNPVIILLRPILTTFYRNMSHFWNISFKKTRFRPTQTKYSLLINRIWNIGKFMYG